MHLDHDEIRRCADRVGTPVRDGEAEDLASVVNWMAESVGEFLSEARQHLPAPHHVAGPRRVLGAPSAGRDPLNAVIREVDVTADPSEITSDLLKGRTVAFKDLVSVAGIPMTLAARFLDGFTPQEDAVLTERVLRAGGRLVALTNLEGMAFGGGGESGAYGATRNPYDLGRSTGGSSGGSAAALYYDIDVTFGTDQGGSVRHPASWCGVLGLKPTYGLVPYRGIASHDPTIDHVGPMSRTTEDLARAMAATYGRDPEDSRQYGPEPSDLRFLAAIENAPRDYRGVRFGVLREALRSDGSAEREAALEAFSEAMAKIEKLGGEVVEVSIPEHTLGNPIVMAIAIEGLAATLAGAGEGYHWRGRQSIELRHAVAKGVLAGGADFQPAYKAAAILGEHLRGHWHGEAYATAQLLAPRVREAYDRALATVDVVVMPTTPTTAMELKPDAGTLERQQRSFSMAADTPTHNATGHPALSMPAAEVGGLPLGVMLVGSYYSDPLLIALARTWELEHGWLPGGNPVQSRPWSQREE